MILAASKYWWIAILTLVVLGTAYFFEKKNQSNMRSWIKAEFWPSLIPDFSALKFKLKWITLFISFIFIVLALLRPQWGEREELLESRGMDIVFVLDLSNSMLAEDVNPSRLNRAQVFIKKTLTQLADDRVGVVAFAGNAFLAIPLTTDFGYVSEIVDTLTPDAIATQGTEISTAIDVAVGAFERGGADTRKTSRAIVLISDGEDFGRGADAAAAKVKEFGAGFFAFSVGTTAGAPIPVRNEEGVLQVYKKDRSPQTVLSKTNPELMNKIAVAAGGKFFELSNTDDAAFILAKQLLGYQRDSTKEQRQVTRIERFQYFLAIGVLFFFLHLFVGYRKPTVKTVAVIFFICFPLFGQAQTFSGYLNNKNGINQYKKNDYESSSKSFEAARQDNTDNTVMEFNQATALAKAKRPEDAIHHFEETTKKALSQGDFDMAAKSLYNQGLIQKENKNFKEAFQKLTNAVEMAKISNQPELEKKAREALLRAVQEQKQQQKSDQSSESKNSKDQKDQKDQNNEKDSKNSKDDKNQQIPEDGKRREFKSGTLSKDVAEGIMNDLSDREKQLYQRRMKEKKSKEASSDKDW